MELKRQYSGLQVRQMGMCARSMCTSQRAHGQSVQHYMQRSDSVWCAPGPTNALIFVWPTLLAASLSHCVGEPQHRCASLQNWLRGLL